MSCSPYDLKDYAFGELGREERLAMDQHIAACAGCRDEVSALELTRTALLSVTDEEPPRRIAFVSDKVFEPRWWQKIWNSGPQLGFASACVLAGAIVLHGFAPRQAPAQAQAPPVVAIDQARIEAEVGRRVDDAVMKAVAAAEERHATKLLDIVDAKLSQSERRHQADQDEIRDYLLRMHKETALARRAAYYSTAEVTQ
jgi:anti-sigma factor RsiW